jgi:hypothetical protein
MFMFMFMFMFITTIELIKSTVLYELYSMNCTLLSCTLLNKTIEQTLVSADGLKTFNYGEVSLSFSSEVLSLQSWNNLGIASKLIVLTLFLQHGDFFLCLRK